MAFYIEIGLAVGLGLFVLLYSFLNPGISKTQVAGNTAIFLVILFVCFLVYRVQI